MDSFLAIILTAHVPYLRTAGRHPHGEDALHETMAFALIPTINVLSDLREAGMQAPVGLAISPILLEQLADTIVQKHFLSWMEEWLEVRTDALARWERQGGAHASYLARFYVDWGRGILRSFTDRYNRDLPGALRVLCAGLAEPLSGAATHPYLPLLQHSGSLHTQIHTGLMTTARHLGRMPDGIWLPECGFDPRLMPALRSSEMRYLIADPSSVSELIPRQRPRWAVPGRLQVLVRDTAAAEFVWSADLGYPGDPVYRSPKRDPRSGMELWRNSLSDNPIDLYDPYDAYRRAAEHASHFLASVGAQLALFDAQHDRPGVAIVPIDLELLGRRWFEGPIWLRAVLERAMRAEGPALAAPIEYLRAYRSRQTVALRDGSWGPGGDHQAWASASAGILQATIAEAEAQMATMAQRFPCAEGEQERALNQALRELLLAQSSDWLFLAGQGALDEAQQRVQQHLGRFWQLCQIAQDPEVATYSDTIAEIEELDNPFPHLNYRIFTEQE
jgi:1,4-alpha-glucan branching enzyme